VSALAHELHEHPVQWVTASPLWTDAVRGGLRDATPQEEARMQQPTILRLATDDFMDELARVLAGDPAQLKAYEAQPASFRARPPGAPAAWPPVPAQLKLYQPAHGDFYLVTATLVCRRPGLPEHLVRPEVREKVGFVLRRVAAGAELAWVDDPSAPKGKTWRAVAAADAQTVVEGEDVKPMFPLNFSDAGRTRRLFAGLVPTSSGETLKNAGVAALVPAAADLAAAQDARLDTLDAKVIEPLKALKKAPQRPDGVSNDEWAKILAATRLAKIDASRFLLLDLAEFLAAHVPQTWQRIASGLPPQPGAPLLHAHLRETVADAGTTWAEALRVAWLQRERILGLAQPAPSLAVDLEHADPDPKVLRGWISLALPLQATKSAAAGATPSTPGPESANVPKTEPTGQALYRIRCVYQRPECGPLHDDVVSEPTRDFQIASFFDPDAPARPIQISLPIDPKDLRTSAKNVSVLLSDAMRAQMSRATDLAALMKGSMASGESFDLGLVCSFSIPIITICALILLMIIVSLLNIVFWWLPFFRICFPIPVKAAK
jgi:hypothetical protein